MSRQLTEEPLAGGALTSLGVAFVCVEPGSNLQPPPSIYGALTLLWPSVSMLLDDQNRFVLKTCGIHCHTVTSLYIMHPGKPRLKSTRLVSSLAVLPTLRAVSFWTSWRWSPTQMPRSGHLVKWRSTRLPTVLVTRRSSLAFINKQLVSYEHRIFLGKPFECFATWGLICSYV